MIINNNFNLCFVDLCGSKVGLVGYDKDTGKIVKVETTLEPKCFLTLKVIENILTRHTNKKETKSLKIEQIAIEDNFEIISLIFVTDRFKIKARHIVSGEQKNISILTGRQVPLTFRQIENALV